MADRIWHCPNGEPVEMTPEEVEALDFVIAAMEESEEES